VASAGGGAKATNEDPFLRRRNLKITSTVKPIQAKAAPIMRITAGIESMANSRDGAPLIAAFIPKGY
jgi:hypothetical protein